MSTAVATDHGSWESYQLLVLHRLNRLDANHQDLMVKVSDIDKSLAGLQARAGVWGALAGVLAGGLVAIIVALIV